MFYLLTTVLCSPFVYFINAFTTSNPELSIAIPEMIRKMICCFDKVLMSFAFSAVKNLTLKPISGKNAPDRFNIFLFGVVIADADKLFSVITCNIT